VRVNQEGTVRRGLGIFCVAPWRTEQLVRDFGSHITALTTNIVDARAAVV
jgi:hypothetical protein